MTVKGLNDKQKRFCEEFVVDYNGTQAAIRAKYSKKTAEVQASRLLRNAKVQEYIAGLKKKQSKRTEITADRVLQEYARIAFAREDHIASFGSKPVTQINEETKEEKVVGYTPFVDIKNSADLSEDILAAISEVKIVHTSGGSTLSLKMHDKMKALDKLALHTGIEAGGGVEDKVAQPMSVTFNVAPAVSEVKVTRGTNAK